MTRMIKISAKTHFLKIFRQFVTKLPFVFYEEETKAKILSRLCAMLQKVLASIKHFQCILIKHEKY